MSVVEGWLVSIVAPNDAFSATAWTSTDDVKAHLASPVVQDYLSTLGDDADAAKEAAAAWNGGPLAIMVRGKTEGLFVFGQTFTDVTA